MFFKTFCGKDDFFLWQFNQTKYKQLIGIFPLKSNGLLFYEPLLPTNSHSHDQHSSTSWLFFFFSYCWNNFFISVNEYVCILCWVFFNPFTKTPAVFILSNILIKTELWKVSIEFFSQNLTDKPMSAIEICVITKTFQKQFSKTFKMFGSRWFNAS